ncbi:hypothetical protein P154DRAFT_521889 [Amniculicola lignicola CBS 123094]|uniref:Uncharacterized protein n=1 Tax=Amniculicola lignicola CBS 123094 TaxID=1392246 RepID=A0A6A5WHM8_9PLEO|nr:hypothetical protein P154DRAFT_521889 [Amniculicola lignicola CBS 123094]
MPILRRYEIFSSAYGGFKAERISSPTDGIIDYDAFLNHEYWGDFFKIIYTEAME